MTDGCVYSKKDKPNTKVVSLVSKDRDWLELVNSFISPDKPILFSSGGCPYLSYGSSAIGRWLEARGCVARKSLILQFPIFPEEYIADFLRGCWDGDGSLSFTKGGHKARNWQRQANLTSGSFDFCTALCSQLFRLGVKSSVYEHGRGERMIEGRRLGPSTSCWRVVLTSGQDVYKLVKLLYYDGHPLSMPRKNKIASMIIEDWERLYFCQACGINLELFHRAARRPKFCMACKREEQNGRARERYRKLHPLKV